MKRLGFFGICWVWGVLAGCQKLEAAPGTNANGASSTAVAVSSAAPASSGTGSSQSASCALITKAEIEAALHVPYNEPTEPQSGMCGYKPVGGRFTRVYVEYWTALTRAQFESQTTRAAEILHVKREPIAGFGEEAFLIGQDHISVFQHGKGVGISAPLQPLSVSERDALAKIVVAKL